MPSVTVISIKRAICGPNGEQSRGAEQTSETEQIHSLEDVQRIIEGLNIRHAFYQNIAPLSQVKVPDVSVLVLFAQDRDRSYISVYYNTGVSGPSIQV